jgi:hypothetical protein
MQKNKGFATSIYFIMNDSLIRNYGTQPIPSTIGGQAWVVRQLAIWNLITELDQTTLPRSLAARFIPRDLIPPAVEPRLLRTASSPTGIRNA